MMLTACSQRNWHVQGESKKATDAVVFALHITKNKTPATWVCYTEIQHYILAAVSCQNDTALPLFSAGRIKDNNTINNARFEFSLLSKRLLLISPENTLAYLQIALYPTYQVNSKQLEISKKADKTNIKDPVNQLKVEIKRL